MKKINFEATLTYDDNIMHGKDQEAINWFYKIVLKKTLVLHSNEIGDEIGTIKIKRIIK